MKLNKMNVNDTLFQYLQTGNFRIESAFKPFKANTHPDPDEYKQKQDFTTAVNWSYKVSLLTYFPIYG